MDHLSVAPAPSFYPHSLDAPVQRLADQAEAFVAFSERRSAPNDHEVMASVYAMCATLLECEAAGFDTAASRQVGRAQLIDVAA